MVTQVKICGITTPDAMDAASMADYIGLVFYARSPRAITPVAAGQLRRHGPQRVGLFVDADDALLRAATDGAALDMIQLHGDENPQRVRDIKALTGKPVLKAIRVAGTADIEGAKFYEDVADWLIFDAHVPGQAGGTGRVFDWSLLKDYRGRLPWMLSGGLNAANVGAALSVLRPAAVDVSSGVESAPGQKDPGLIRDFIATVRSLN